MADADGGPNPLTTEVCEDGAPRLELDGAELHVAVGPDRGTRVPLGLSSLRIGSAPDCELVLHDRTVSGYHAEIICSPRGYLVRDLGSKNGVRLGAFAVERAPLADGMRLGLGETVIAVHTLGERKRFALVEKKTVGALVAHSLKMRAFAAELARLAPTEVTVLLEGETGTGKEVAARTLHELSPRARAPFVVFDSGAIVSDLVAAELFGHERGAFTGAERARPGLFAEADGGTLFLDEIGELPLEVQPVLLRVLERRASRRVGGDREVAHDVRVIAATNRNLSEEVRAGRFREDLYFRLVVARLRLPPLRERAEDVPILGKAFASRAGLTLSPDLIRLLEAYEWPGNVRELKNTIERMAAMPERSEEVVAELRGASGRFREDGALIGLSQARRQAANEFERAYLREVLAQAGWNYTQAARLAGVSRQVLMELAARHNMRARDLGSEEK